MRNKNKSILILLPLFINLNTTKKGFGFIVKKNNIFFSLEFVKNYFFLYNGLNYSLTRVRVPFTFNKLSSFINSKAKFDSIPQKFKRLAQKKLPKKKLKK